MRNDQKMEFAARKAKEYVEKFPSIRLNGKEAYYQGFLDGMNKADLEGAKAQWISWANNSGTNKTLEQLREEADKRFGV
jgi:hypothetical protein